MVVAADRLTNVPASASGPSVGYAHLYESLDKPRSHPRCPQPGKFMDPEKVDHFHMQQFAYLLKKMNAIEEALHFLLDNTIFTYGSGLGDGATTSSALPIIVAGSAGGRLKTGAHINLSETTGPVAKVNGKHVNPKQGRARQPLAHPNAGLRPEQDRFADSSGVEVDAGVGVSRFHFV